MWDKITVGQFQAIYQIAKGDLDDTDKACGLISIIYGMTPAQVDDLPITKFNELAAATAQILDIKEMPGRPQRFIKANGKKYGIIYDISKLKHRQYVESTHWATDTIENIHLIMASIVQPVNWFGKWGKNEAANHSKVAEDMLKAKITDVYHSCVFFCELYMNYMRSITPIQVIRMEKQGINREQATELLNGLIDVTAGFIPQKKLRTLKV